MKAPKCRLCGSHHYTHQPHRFEPGEDGPKRQPARKPRKKISSTPSKPRTFSSVPALSDCPVCGGDESVLEDALKHRARLEKQRELMRKRRAKK